MQVILKRDCLSAWQKALVGVLVVALSASTGCQRLGTAVSKYLPAKRKQVAAKDEAGKPAETSPGTSSPESTPMQNMGGSPGGGDFGGPPEDGTGDELQNFGDDARRASTNRFVHD